MSPKTRRGRVPTQCHEIRIRRSWGNPGDAETLTDGQKSGKSGRKTKNGHISTATAEVEPLEAWTPGPRWKGPAKQSLRLAAVEFDAVGVPVEMILVRLIEWLEKRIMGTLVGNHGVVAMSREDGHVAWNTHELIHQ